MALSSMLLLFCCLLLVALGRGHSQCDLASFDQCSEQKDQTTLMQSKVSISIDGVSSTGKSEYKSSKEWRRKSFTAIQEQTGFVAPDQKSAPEGKATRTSALLVVVLAAIPVGILILAAFLMMHGTKPSPRERQHALSCFYSFNQNTMFSIIIPGVLDLSAAVGQGPIYSGFLIGTMKLGMCLGSCVPWLCLKRDPESWRTKSAHLLTTGLGLAVLGACAYAVLCLFITFNTASEASARHLSALLLVARPGQGIGWGIVQNTSRNQIAHLAPPSERPLKMVYFLVANAIGMGLGPLLASGADALAGVVTSLPVPMYAPVAVVGLVFPSISLVSLMIAPSIDLEVDQIVAVSPGTEPSGNEASSRRYMVLSALAFSCLRGASVSSLESGTALLLEIRFHWNLQSIGMAIGCCYLLCPICTSLMQLMPGECTSLHMRSRFLMCLVFLGSAMMLYTGNALVLLVADSLLLAGFFVGDSLLQGMVQQYLFPAGSLFDVNNISLGFQVVVDGCGRFLGPPLARWHVMHGGQLQYALQQLMFCVVGWVVLEWLLQHKAQVDDERAPPHQGFDDHVDFPSSGQSSDDRFLSKKRQEDNSVAKHNPLIPKRWVLACLLIGCNASMYLCRANASDAVLQMFPHDKGKQSMVLTAFFGGYMCQFIYGPLIEWYGAKPVLTCAVVAYGLFTLLTAQFGSSLVIAMGLRALVGLAQGAIYPSQCSLTAAWYPAAEWNLAWSLTSGGEALGTIAMLGLGPVLMHHFAWQSIFWFSGTCAVVWVLLFSAWATSKPEDPNSMVPAAELEYILATRSPTDSKTDTPWWQSILYCRPFWSTVVTHVCFNYGFFVALGWLPSYFADPPFNAKYSQMGIFTVLPYISLFVIAAVAGTATDRLLKRGYSLLTIRKAMNTIGFLGPALCFFLLRFCRTHDSVYTAAALASAAVGLSGCAFSGYWANFCDLSPRYSAQMLSISNSIACLPGIAGNIVTGKLLAGSNHVLVGWEAYDKVFAIACGAYLVGALVFLVFTEVKPQF